MEASYPTKKGQNPPNPGPSPPSPTPPSKPETMCDDYYSCPSGTTCCCVYQYQNFCFGWGCCPLESATCCDDHSSCCPRDYPICDTQAGTCRVVSIKDACDFIFKDSCAVLCWMLMLMVFKFEWNRAKIIHSEWELWEEHQLRAFGPTRNMLPELALHESSVESPLFLWGIKIDLQQWGGIYDLESGCDVWMNWIFSLILIAVNTNYTIYYAIKLHIFTLLLI